MICSDLWLFNVVWDFDLWELNIFQLYFQTSGYSYKRQNEYHFSIMYFYYNFIILIWYNGSSDPVKYQISKDEIY